MEKEKDLHSQKVRHIADQISNWTNSDRKKKLRFKHGSTNSTRSCEGDYEYIDTSSLSHVLEVNTEEKWALVEANVPMDALVEETLKYNLLPEVVMEFPGITVGGGIQGAALESSSFKYGQFNDTCIEYELVTGEGKIVRASRNENGDLFYGISGSYGTLAVVTLAKIRLVPAKKFVKLSYIPIESQEIAIDILKEESLRDSDFLEGIIFSPKAAIVIKGRLTEESLGTIRRFSRAHDPWFYRNVQEILKRNKDTCVEYVPIRDYLFRYNRGAFWMGEYALSILHLPRAWIGRFLFNYFLITRNLYERLHAVNISQNYIIQDFYYPFMSAINYLRFNQSEMGIYPVWLCPIKATSIAQKLSPHYSPTESLLLNIGIYGQSKTFPQPNIIESNRKLEIFAEEHSARKMFYAQSYYPKEEFWKIYDYSWYKDLKKETDPGGVFPDVWEKISVRRNYSPRLVWGLFMFSLKKLFRSS